MMASPIVCASAGRRELRHDRRYLTPALALEIEGLRLAAVNWSLGGFLVRGGLVLDVGTSVRGTMSLPGSDGFSFGAKLVRKDAEGRGLAFHFTELAPLALSRWHRTLTPRRRGPR
jgi:hypothetical protein